MTKPPAFHVNGLPVPGSYYGMVLWKVCHGDEQAAARIFARAHFCKADNVAKWVKEGLKQKPGEGVPYALRACAMEISDPQGFREWIDKEIFKITSTRKPLAGAVRAALMDMANGITE